MRECARCCVRDAERGVLCGPCADALPRARGLLSEHVHSAAPREGAPPAWLVDRFGVPHPLAGARAAIGRRPDADLDIQHTAVSRNHAELRRAATGWLVRDVGSRNGTFVDDARVTTRATVLPGMIIRFGDVAFYLIDGGKRLAADGPRSVETSHRAAAVRYHLEHGQLELCLLASPATAGPPDVAGVLLHRRRGEAQWIELTLPPLEHQLLQLLCEQAAAEAASTLPTRGTVATRVLARKLGFRTRFANEENVRGLVRRARGSLHAIGADDLLASVPGRGYFLAGVVSSS